MLLSKRRMLSKTYAGYRITVARYNNIEINIKYYLIVYMYRDRHKFCFFSKNVTAV